MKVKVVKVIKEEGKEPREEKRELEVTPLLEKALNVAIQHHGEEQVLKAVNEKIVSGVRARVSALLLKGASKEEIEKAVREFKLSTRERKDPMAKLVELFNSLPAEEKAKYLAELKK